MIKTVTRQRVEIFSKEKKPDYYDIKLFAIFYSFAFQQKAELCSLLGWFWVASYKHSRPWCFYLLKDLYFHIKKNKGFNNLGGNT